jgi:sortase A
MGYIKIPAIGATIPIEHGISDETLQNAAGHLECSSLPVGGSGTHTILSGHRGLPSSVLFTNLDQVRVGDRIYLYVLDDTLAYEVDKTEVVLPTETRSLNIVPGEDRITLVTCTPYGINTHRILVHGHRVPYVPAQEERDGTRVSRVSWISKVNLTLLAAGLIAAILIITLVPRHYRKKRRR